MANKRLSAAIRLAFKDDRIKTLDDFWRLYGRPDLVGEEVHQSACGLTSIVYEVGRILARRAVLEDQKNYHEITSASGEKRSVFVDPAGNDRPQQVTRFVRDFFDWSGKRIGSRYHFLRSTKGWRAWSIDENERKKHLKDGVPLEVGNRYVVGRAA